MPISPKLITIVVAAGAVLTEIIVVVFLMVKRDETKGWSLSCAASEIVGYDKDGLAVYTSSMSRFIALLGSVAVMWIYLGIGLEIILANGDATKSLKDDEWFLFWGLALFAPYVASQARAAIVGARKDAPRDLAQAKPTTT